MKLGFVTYYSEEIVRFASSTGFDCLEVFVDSGTSLDLDRLTEIELKKILEIFNTAGIKFGTISCNPNHLEGDAKKRKDNNAYFKKAIRMCKKFGTDIVVTNAWADRSKTPQENIKTYKTVFTDYAEIAEEEEVKIAIENCPHWVGYPTSVGNIAFSPEMWDTMFEAVPSKAIGLEFDPSHLFWQGIDYVKAIKNYGDRIYAFHAKDTEILKDKLDKYGIIGKQMCKESEWDSGWWRHRIPGLGEIDWKNIFKVLYEINFSGPMVIEHEDPVFGGDRSENGLTFGSMTEKGFNLGLKYLRNFDV